MSTVREPVQADPEDPRRASTGTPRSRSISGPVRVPGPRTPSPGHRLATAATPTARRAPDKRPHQRTDTASAELSSPDASGLSGVTADSDPPLRSAEPKPAANDQRHELTMTAGEETREEWQWIKDLAAALCMCAA